MYCLSVPQSQTALALANVSPPAQVPQRYCCDLDIHGRRVSPFFEIKPKLIPHAIIHTILGYVTGIAGRTAGTPLEVGWKRYVIVIEAQALDDIDVLDSSCKQILLMEHDSSTCRSQPFLHLMVLVMMDANLKSMIFMYRSSNAHRKYCLSCNFNR